MFFSDVDSSWPIALADCMITGILGIAILLVVASIIMEIVHSMSGYNGTRPTIYFYREARAWWKDPQ